MDVTSEEEADSAASLELHHSDGRLEELVDGRSEQLVTRVTIENGLEFLAGVTLRVEPGPRQNRFDLTAEHRDRRGVRVVRLAGEEADDPTLADDVSVGAERLRADDVIRTGPVHDTRRLGLGDQEYIGGPPLVGGGIVEPHLVTHDPEARSGHLAECALLRAEVGGADEGEIVVGDPSEQCSRLLAVNGFGRVDRLLLDIASHLGGAFAKELPIGDCSANVRQGLDDGYLDGARRGVRCHRLDLDEHV